MTFGVIMQGSCMMPYQSWNKFISIILVVLVLQRLEERSIEEKISIINYCNKHRKTVILQHRQNIIAFIGNYLKYLV